MADLKIRIDGKEMEVPFGTSIKDILGIKSAQPYADNPIAGAVVNGMLMSLQEGLKGNADIRTVRVASPLGKRIYRKSLCFLLSYASSAIAPERNLIIGHSLGDGFYFRYRDGNPPDTARLRKAMEEAVAEDLPIDVLSLADDEVLAYSESRKLLETKERFTLDDLIVHPENKMHIICAFMAILEATRNQMIVLYQKDEYGTIYIMKRPPDWDPQLADEYDDEYDTVEREHLADPSDFSILTKEAEERLRAEEEKEREAVVEYIGDEEEIDLMDDEGEDDGPDDAQR